MSELVEGARLEIVYSGNRVGGSNPPLSASLKPVQEYSGDVAQLGERLVRNEEVGGSIPLISTKQSEPEMGGRNGIRTRSVRGAAIHPRGLRGALWPC